MEEPFKTVDAKPLAMDEPFEPVDAKPGISENPEVNGNLGSDSGESAGEKHDDLSSFSFPARSKRNQARKKGRRRTALLIENAHYSPLIETNL